MAHIEVVRADSPYLDDVGRLWRENSNTLGFYTQGAFAERAQKGQILVALDGGTVTGYVLYYTDKHSKTRVTHLCVDEAQRGKGIAQRLIDGLRSHTRSSRGIGLYCRRDFSAWNLWPRLGFHAIREKVGRSKDGHELTFFWISQPHRSLFSFIEDIDDERLTVAIDANIFYDIDDPTRHGADETPGIIADWLQPSIRLCVTQELFNEIQRNPDSEERKRRMSAA